MVIPYKLAAGIVSKHQGKCALCGYAKLLVIEHCHVHDLIRGLVCASCNNRLAQLDAGTKQPTDAEKFYLDNCPSCRRRYGSSSPVSQGTTLGSHASAIGYTKSIMRKAGWRAVTIDMLQDNLHFSRPLTRAIYWSARVQIDPSRSTQRRMRRASRIFDSTYRISLFRGVLDSIWIRFEFFEKLSHWGDYDLESVIISALAKGRYGYGAYMLASLVRTYNGSNVTSTEITYCLRRLRREGKIYYDRSFLGGYLLSPELEYRYNSYFGTQVPLEPHRVSQGVDNPKPLG